jgi:hypothetical protein
MTATGPLRRLMRRKRMSAFGGQSRSRRRALEATLLTPKPTPDLARDFRVHAVFLARLLFS